MQWILYTKNKLQPKVYIVDVDMKYIMSYQLEKCFDTQVVRKYKL